MIRNRTYFWKALYIGILCIFAMNIFIYTTTLRTKQLAINNKIEIDSIKVAIQTFIINDSMFFKLEKHAASSDSLRLLIVQKNSDLLKQNNAILRKLLKSINNDSKG